MFEVLLVDDSPHGLTRLEYQFRSISTDYKLVAVTDPIEATVHLRQQNFAMLFSNYRMAILDGLSLARIANKISPNTSVNLIANHADAIYIKSQRSYENCHNLIVKPCDINELQHAIAQCQRYQELDRTNRQLTTRLAALEKHSGLHLNQVNCR